MKPAAIIPVRENKIHGTSIFPCAFYWIDSSAATVTTPFRCKPHWHDEVEFIYFQAGHYHVNINMQKYEITEETFCFLESGALHAIECEAPYLEKAIVFSPSMLHFASDDLSQNHLLQPLQKGELSFPHFITRKNACFENVRRAYLTISRKFMQEHAAQGSGGEQIAPASAAKQLSIKASLLEILAELSEEGLLTSYNGEDDPHIEMVKKSISYMKEHFSEKIYIRDLAQQVNMNEQYFCRFFKKSIGKSPVEHLTELRIRQALHLLRNTDKSVMEISLECGFHNLGNFMRAFKKTTGYTPLQYRKSASS